jgi:hypothetical protein
VTRLGNSNTLFFRLFESKMSATKSLKNPSPVPLPEAI